MKPRTFVVLICLTFAVQLVLLDKLLDCQTKCNYAADQASAARIELFEALHPMAVAAPTDE